MNITARRPTLTTSANARAALIHAVCAARHPTPRAVLWAAVSRRGKLLDEVALACTALLPLGPCSTLHMTLLRIICGTGVAFEPRAAQPEATPGEPRPLRILLAEDNATNRQVARRLLAKLGYQADVAVNGLEVLAALKRRHYDLVLMDIQMPEMNGTEATYYIRTFWPPEGRPYIAAVTAHASEQDRVRLLSTGMDDFIRKPVRLEELARVLTAVAARLPDTAAAPADTIPSGPCAVFDAGLFAAFIDSVSDGDAQADAALIARYVADMEDQLRQLRAAFAVDGTLAARLAHTLKGLSLQLGAMDLAICCGRVEASGGGAAAGGRTELLRDVERAYATLRSVLAAHGLVGDPADT